MTVFTGTVWNDNLVGTAGADTFKMNPNVYGQDTVSGGGGIDTLSVDYSSLPVGANNISLVNASSGAFSGVLLGDQSESISFSSIEKLNVSLSSGNDAIMVDLAPLQTSTNGLTLNGGAGDDYLGLDLSAFGATTFTVGDTETLTLTVANLSASRLSISGFEMYSLKLGSGSNVVKLGAEGYSVNGGAGSDTIIGGSGNDFIDGGFGNNLIQGGAGNDLIVSMVGNDTIDGGPGEDTWYGAAQDPSDQIFVYDGASASGSVNGHTLFSNIEAVYLAFGSGNDTATIKHVKSTTETSDYGGNGGYNTINIDDSGLSGLKTWNSIGSWDGFTFTGDIEDNTRFRNFQSVKITFGDDSNSVIASAAPLETGGTLTLDAAGGWDGLQLDLSSHNAATTFTATSDGGVVTNVTGLSLSGFEIYYLKLGNGGDAVTLNGLGADSVTGGSGNDTIEGGSGSDTLVGGAGIDTLSYLHASSGVKVDLTIASFQDTGGAGIDSLIGFENIVGSSWNDTLTGDASANTIDGGGGNDILAGGDGDDVLVSGYGDAVDGGGGNDSLSLSLSGLTHGVDLDTASVISGQPFTLGGVSIQNIETLLSLRGSDFADTLRLATQSTALSVDAGGGNDTIISQFSSVSVLGGDGDDRFVSGAAADTFDGGAGNDTVDYSAGAVGQWVDLRINAGSGGDSLISVESVVGSAYADTITGSDGANTLDGGAGNDLLDGAGGVDTVSYASATAAVTVSLGQQGVAQDTHGAGVDTLKGFENLTGSAFADQLNGDGFANVIQGGAGNDTIEGGAGDDVLDGGAGVNLLSYYHATAGVTVDLTLAGPQNTGAMGVDTLSNFQNLNGSAYGDTLRAGAGAHAVAAFGGDDLIYIDNGASGSYDGGAGNDTLSFAKATLGVKASLAVTSVQATGIGSMSFANFEAVVGSAYADSLTGSALANTLTGGGGVDTLVGGAGADVFRYLLASDSTVAAADQINDFQHGIDKLNLTAVRTGAADTYAISTVGSNTQLDVDLHGDGSIDLRVLLVGKSVLTSADLVW